MELWLWFVLIILAALAFTLYQEAKPYLIASSISRWNGLSFLRWKNLKTFKLELDKYLGKFLNNLIYFVIISLLGILLFQLLRLSYGGFLDLPKDFDTHFNTVLDILMTVGLLTLLGIFALIIHWLSSRREGIVILPFDVEINHTPTMPLVNNTDQDETSISKKDENHQLKQINGKAIADLLFEELYRIFNTHRRIQEVRINNPSLVSIIDVTLQGNNFPKFESVQAINLTQIFTNLGTISIGSTQLPVGPALLFLRHLWPGGGVSIVITGSIQYHESALHLIAKVDQGENVSVCQEEHSNSSKQTDGQYAVTSSNSRPDSFSLETVHQMMRPLAYQVAWVLSSQFSGISTRHWQGFMHFTEAIAHYHEYICFKEPEALRKAKKDCEEARKTIESSDKLADLFYKLGLAYFQQAELRLNKEEKENNLDEAEKLFHSALVIDPDYANLPYYYNALGNIFYKKDQFEDAISHYERAKRNVPKKHKISFPFPDNGLGDVSFVQGNFEKALGYYDAALKEAKQEAEQEAGRRIELWKTHYNLGKVYLYSEKNFDPKEARFHFKEAQAKSRSLNRSEPYTGLGLAILFEAVRDFSYDKNRQVLNQKLEDAFYQMQTAIDLDLDERISAYRWNIGLVYLWQRKIEKAYKAWKEAANIAARQEADLCMLIYNVAATSLTVKLYENPVSRIAHTFPDALITILRQQTYIKRGYLKMVLKDLEFAAQTPSMLESNKAGIRGMIAYLIQCLDY